MPTVADVLTLPVVRRGRPKVVAGRAGLGRPVRWAHSAEISDIARLVRPDDLMLTTGIALPEQESALAAYVEDLAAAGACALVVELGRRWRDSPSEAMAAACEKAALPLVTLGRETRFAAVTEAVGTLVVDGHLDELRFARETHRTFDALMLAGAPPEAILAEVQRMSGLPVVLESIGHDILAYDVGTEDNLEILHNWWAHSRSLVASDRATYDEDLGWLVGAVRARGQDWGRVVLVSPEHPTPQHWMLIESAASALALQRLAARDREGLERQTHRALLDRLASGGPPKADLVRRCAAIGVPLTGRHLVGLVVAPVDEHPPGQSTSTAPLTTQERLHDVAELTSRAARARDIDALVAVMDDAAVVVLTSFATGAIVDAKLSDLAREVHRAFGKPRALGIHQAADTTSSSATVLIAAGSTVTSPKHVARSLAEARHVLRARPRRAADRSYQRLSDVHLRGLIHLLADDERVKAFIDREVGALVAHDEAHATGLVEVVAALVRHGGNKAAAATSVHLSRPAFYDRLARAERILGVDLADPELRTSMHVALLALDATQPPG